MQVGAIPVVRSTFSPLPRHQSNDIKCHGKFSKIKKNNNLKEKYEINMEIRYYIRVHTSHELVSLDIIRTQNHTKYVSLYIHTYSVSTLQKVRN